MVNDDDDNDIYEIDSDDESDDDQDSLDLDASLESDDDSFADDEDDFISPYDSPFDTAASVVEDWARSSGVERDAFVLDFVGGLRNRSDLTYWASVDLEEEFPEPDAAGLLRKASKWLIRLRNVAVFVPVGLTWWAISVVSPGFKSFADERLARKEDANFFQYWTQVEIDSSFSFLPSDFFQIQEIAGLGSFIILLIILATVLAQILNGVIDWRTDKATESRNEAIRTVRRVLHSSREATPESLATSLAESMTELLESSRLIIDAARRLEQASVGVSQLEPTFQSLNDQLGQFDTRLRDTIIGSVDRLNTSVDSLSTLMDGNLRGLLAESVAGIDEVRQQLHRTAASVEFGTQQLLKDLSQMTSQTKGGRPLGPSVRVPNGPG